MLGVDSVEVAFYGKPARQLGSVRRYVEVPILFHGGSAKCDAI